jgi:hypothetical protein
MITGFAAGFVCVCGETQFAWPRPRCKGMAELPEEAKSAGDYSPAGVGIRGLDRCHTQNWSSHSWQR